MCILMNTIEDTFVCGMVESEMMLCKCKQSKMQALQNLTTRVSVSVCQKNSCTFAIQTFVVKKIPQIATFANSLYASVKVLKSETFKLS